jgi:hypothetical protein
MREISQLELPVLADKHGAYLLHSMQLRMNRGDVSLSY